MKSPSTAPFPSPPLSSPWRRRTVRRVQPLALTAVRSLQVDPSHQFANTESMHTIVVTCEHLLQPFLAEHNSCIILLFPFLFVLFHLSHVWSQPPSRRKGVNFRPAHPQTKQSLIRAGQGERAREGDRWRSCRTSHQMLWNCHGMGRGGPLYLPRLRHARR